MMCCLFIIVLHTVPLLPPLFFFLLRWTIHEGDGNAIFGMISSTPPAYIRERDGNTFLRVNVLKETYLNFHSTYYWLLACMMKPQTIIIVYIIMPLLVFFFFFVAP